MHRYKIDPSKALLGSGGEGKVLEVIKIKEDGTEGGMFVMKQRMCTSIEEANNGLSETLALARFQNEHIVSFEDIFIHVPPDNREMCYVCIVMEHCNNGNLFDNIMNRNSNYAQNNNNNTHSTISNGSDSSNTSSNFNISSSNLLSSSFSGSTLHSSLMLPKTASKDNNDNDDNDNENERDNEECIRITHSPSAPELSFTPSSPSSSRFRPISISNSPVPFRNSPSLSLSSSPSTTPIITSRNSTSIRISNRLSTPLYAIYEAEQSPSSSPPTFTSTFRDSTKLLPKVVLDALSEPTFSSVTDLPPPPPEPEPEPISLSSTPEKSLPSFMTSPSPSLPVRSKSDSSKSKKGKPKTKSDTGDKLGKRLRSPSSLGNMPFYCSPASLSSPALTQSGSSLRASSPTPSLDFYPREQLLDWMYQICNAIYAIHNAKLVHRDLKSENIFISNGRIKIGDFGLAVMHKNEKVKGVAGTYYYSSPELLQDKLYDRAGDIFALGCIFYEMSTLTLLPIQRKCFGSELLKNTFSAAQVMLDFPDGLKDIAELVLKMLNPEPLMRPHIDSILKLPMFASNRRLSSPPAVISPVVEPINLAGGVVRQLIESDRDAFSEIMSRAYFPDPLIRYVLEKNKNNHPLIMAAVFKHMFSTFRSKNYSLWGYFDKTKKLLAACVWVPPDNEARKPTFGEMFQILFNGKTVGLPALRRWRKSLNRVQAVTVDHSWHLLYAAVEPEFQNRGIGKKLVAPVLQWADNEDRFATASIWNDRALHFLEQLGFSVQSVHKDETGKGLPFTYMKRKPNKVDE